MSNGSRAAVMLVDGGKEERGDEMVSAHRLGGDGGSRGGGTIVEPQRGMALFVLGGTSFRGRDLGLGLSILRAGGTGRDEGGDGCSAAKSARSSPGGSEGGHKHLRFGVEGKRLSGAPVGVDGRLRLWVGSHQDDRRRFLGRGEEACADAVAVAPAMANALWRRLGGEEGSTRDARRGADEVLLARRDCKATQVAWILGVVCGGHGGVRGGDGIDDGDDDGQVDVSHGSADGRSIVARCGRLLGECARWRLDMRRTPMRLR
ncbi:hypothetical protein MMC07_009280 [Pseudocyphellaria aurata]|nr:hypothetical protein [Pseudocyphellaria aurata]